MKKNIKKKLTKKAEVPQAKEGKMEEKPFDFGGLPERNLKKNLGC